MFTPLCRLYLHMIQISHENINNRLKMVLKYFDDTNKVKCLLFFGSETLQLIERVLVCRLFVYGN